MEKSSDISHAIKESIEKHRLVWAIGLSIFVIIVLYIAFPTQTFNIGDRVADSGLLCPPVPVDSVHSFR